MPSPNEQRNPYFGAPERPWLSVRLEARDGTTRLFKLIADSGSPFAIILDEECLAEFKHRDGPPVDTNFGPLDGAWFKISMPEMGLTQKIFGCGSAEVAAGAKANHPEFEGLAGLPFLRLLEYGGNADEFWIRRPQ
jgi:hypothetical protein